MKYKTGKSNVNYCVSSIDATFRPVPILVPSKSYGFVSFVFKDFFFLNFLTWTIFTNEMSIYKFSGKIDLLKIDILKIDVRANAH